MKKRLISLLLVLSILALAACSAAEPETSAPADSEAPASEAPASDAPDAEAGEEAPEAEPSEEAQPEGPTYAQVDYELPLFTDGETLSIWYPLRQDNVQAPLKDSGDQVFWKTVQEMTGIHIDFTEPGQAVGTEQYNLMVASDSMTDLIMETLCTSGDGGAYTGGYDLAIEDEVYLDLTELIEEHCPNYCYWINASESNRRAAYTDSGRMGAFLNINAEERIQNQGIGMNQELFEATGLDVPETPSDWTEMYAALKANGVEYPCDINTELGVLEGGLAAAMGAVTGMSFVIDAATDEFVFGPTTDETRAYIELLREYYEAGYMDSNFVSAATVMNNTNFNSGRTFTTRLMQQQIATYFDSYGVHVQPAPAVRAEDAPESGMYLVGEAEMSLVTNAGMAVSSNCEDVDSALLLMDWFYSEDGGILSNWGVEGITFEFINGEPVINDFYQERTDGVFNRGIYTASGDFGLVWPNCSLATAGELERTAMDNWTAKVWDGFVYYSLPAVNLTSDESSSIGNSWADIETVVDSSFLSWIVGDSELNDDTWNTLVSTVDNLGLQTCKEAYEAAYARYLAK